MNAERTADCISELLRPKLVMLGKDFDAFGQSTPFHRHPHPCSKVVDINTAIACQGRSAHENPEVTTAAAHFQGGFDSVLQQEMLKFEQIFHRTVVVRVDGHP